MSPAKPTVDPSATVTATGRLTDRQRVERVLFPRMLLSVLVDGVETKDEDYYNCRKLLHAASDEALVGCAPDKRIQLLRRALRVQLAITQPFLKEGVDLAKIGLIEVYVLQRILELGYLELIEGSDFSQALEIFLAGVSHVLNEPKLDASAQKQANKMFVLLREQGYFV